MPGKAFIDTNVWIYLFAEADTPAAQRKRAAARELFGHLETQNTSLTVSAQVLNEFVNVLRGKYRQTTTLIRPRLQHIIAVAEIAPLSSTRTLEALQWMDRHTLSWFDALIVAVALHCDCDTLYSEDLHDGLVIGSLRVVNPFA